jgi:DeoR/GlpR family transcriptional regulator of sugar metabolism
VDAWKFGSASLVPIAEVVSFDIVVTDARIDADVAAQHRGAGVKLEVAPAAVDDDE